MYLSEFRADEFDYVRRFITLIDLAYEAKARIVCLISATIQAICEDCSERESSRRRTPAAAEGDKREKRRWSGSSVMSTFIGKMEWSATGLPTSLASGEAGETDVRFAIGRTVARPFEMGSKTYGFQEAS